MKTIYIVLRNAVFCLTVAKDDCEKLVADFNRHLSGRKTIAGMKSTQNGSVHVELSFTLDEVIAIEVSA